MSRSGDSLRTKAAARSPRTVRTVRAVREAISEWRAAGESIAFVPTMGNLHAGHLSLARLVAEPRTRVVMSIFVNPTQFGPGEDFAAYPRTLTEDTALVTAAGTVDLLFAPEAADIYPFGLNSAARVSVPELGRELDGASRPGHFDGVASVVTRLLNIVTPDVLMLGQKDYQQFILMQRMIADLHLPVVLRMGPTHREPDGLAKSLPRRGPEGQGAGAAGRARPRARCGAWWCDEFRRPWRCSQTRSRKRRVQTGLCRSATRRRSRGVERRGRKGSACGHRRRLARPSAADRQSARLVFADRDAIAAAFFGVVHRGVGALYERSNVFPALEAGDADGNRDCRRQTRRGQGVYLLA